MIQCVPSRSRRSSCTESIGAACSLRCRPVSGAGVPRPIKVSALFLKIWCQSPRCGSNQALFLRSLRAEQFGDRTEGPVPIPGQYIVGDGQKKRKIGTSAPDTMCTVAQQAKLLHRINRRSLFLTVQTGIRCRCTAPADLYGGWIGMISHKAHAPNETFSRVLK